MRSVASAARSQFAELAPVWSRVRAIVAEENVEKYRGAWRFATEQLVFLASITHWLDTRQLITHEQAVALIGVGTNPDYEVKVVSFQICVHAAAGAGREGGREGEEYHARRNDAVVSTRWLYYIAHHATAKSATAPHSLTHSSLVMCCFIRLHRSLSRTSLHPTNSFHNNRSSNRNNHNHEHHQRA